MSSQSPLSNYIDSVSNPLTPSTSSGTLTQTTDGVSVLLVKGQLHQRRHSGAWLVVHVFIICKTRKHCIGCKTSALCTSYRSEDLISWSSFL